jgi:acyl-CoA synthetase (AMP-forming)/AMP-acid ligase II
MERFGAAVAVVSADGGSISYAEFAEMADALAQPLGQGRRLVSIELDNAIEPLAFYVGALRAGHVAILHGGDEAADAGIKQVFSPNAAYAKISGAWRLENFDADALALHPELAVLLSTSGSAAKPKFVRLSHQNLLSNAGSIAEYLELAPGERAITSLPSYYSYGLSILHSHLLFGHTVVLNNHSVAEEAFWETVDREGVTSLAGVPHSYELLINGPFYGRDLSSLRYLTQAGGKLSPERVREIAGWADRAGKRFYVMYGQTEASPRMAYLPPSDAAKHPNCIGRAIPGGRFRLAAIEPDAGLPQGAGELVYEGPNVMMGYASAREHLAEAAGAAVLHTGDIAVFGAHGYYSIVGRKSRFAKLFGRRLSFDDVEDRLAAIGVVAAVSGDDNGIVAVASVTDGEPIAQWLSHELNIPAPLIHVEAGYDIPRLPNGKPDYGSVLALRPEPVKRGQESLSASITAILGRKSIDANQSFAELGGDSLTLVQALLAVEAYLGYAPDDWETTPIRQLERMARAPQANAPKKVRPTLSMAAFDAVRAGAVLLALFTHATTRAGIALPAQWELFERLSTPTFIILFGAMVGLLYANVSTATKSYEQVAKNALCKALQCYAFFALNVLALWVVSPSGWKYALISMAMLGAMPYAGILAFYTIMFLMIPLLLWALNRIGFWLLFCASLAVHAAFLALKGVPTPPLINHQPIFQRVLDLFVGAGDAPTLAGPSIAHGLVLVLAGYWVGLAAKKSFRDQDSRRAFLIRQAPLAAIFAAAGVLSFFVPHFPVTLPALAGMELRNLNHPAYVFLLGLPSLLILQLLLVWPAIKQTPRWLMRIARRSLFGFGIGNAIIALIPSGWLSVFPPVVTAALLLTMIVSLIYYYDWCMRTGAHARGPSRWVFDLSARCESAVQGTVQGLARGLRTVIEPSAAARTPS